jgi:hypothetical protein
MAKTKRSKQYSLLRMTTVLMTAFMLPVGTFVGFQFGKGNYSLAVSSLFIQMFLTLLQAHIWWLTLEKSRR